MHSNMGSDKGVQSQDQTHRHGGFSDDKQNPSEGQMMRQPEYDFREIVNQEVVLKNGSQCSVKD